jgi:uncharacterized protein
MRWYRKAAEQGDGLAQDRIGRLYEEGWGVAQDYHEAMRWYQQGAERGNAYAQKNIGRLYYLGRGVTQDYTEGCAGSDRPPTKEILVRSTVWGRFTRAAGG